jgi:ribose 1,5-bisphosphokinase
VTTRRAAADPGTLVLIVGPSGVGKDALINYCRLRLVLADSVVFARRAITRPAGDGDEDHEPVSETEFERQAGNGGFTLFWRAHGLGYGVPASIMDDLAAGRTIVVNVSRSVIDEARVRFRPLLVISITAPQEVVAWRLRSRGRETEADIDRRIVRAKIMEVAGTDVVSIDNTGPIEIAGEALLRLLTQPRI